MIDKGLWKKKRSFPTAVRYLEDKGASVVAIQIPELQVSFCTLFTDVFKTFHFYNAVLCLLNQTLLGLFYINFG